MRKIFVLILSLQFCFANAQQPNDPVVMTVGDMEVPLSEFLFLAQKDSEVDLFNKESLQNYVELFKTFKQKVADARSLRIQESMLFQSELSSYQAQLIESLLIDREGEQQAMRKVYEMGKEILSVGHILFRLPDKSLTKDTLEVYNKANEIYQRIKAGEDFAAIGNELVKDEDSEIIFEEDEYLYPLESLKAIVELAYTMSEGEVSAPVRTPLGFHIVRLNRKLPDNVRLQVAHILIEAPENEDFDEQALLKQATEVYEKAKAGEDFTALVEEYSYDMNTRTNGGVLPYFGRGFMVLPFEQAAFSLANIGDIAAPVRTRFGYHIIKLLDRKGYPTFEEMEQGIYQMMRQGEWSHELAKAFDERQKEKLGYTFNQEAYDELRRIADDYFPTDTTFYIQAIQLTKPLMYLDGRTFPQYEFADFIRIRSTSIKTYSVDFLDEQYALFVREILKKLTEMNIEDDPEFINLMNEYHDGILLFEVSNTRVWEKPFEEHEQLEKEWLQDLDKKYKVTVNWDVLNNLKKYMK